MSASNLFSPRRFAALAAQQWQEQRRAWGVFALVLGVLFVLLAAFMLTEGRGSGVKTSAQVFAYYACLFLAGYLFAHQVLGVWRSREAALLYLMRPASTFEKWLLMTLTLLVVFPLLYTLVFAAVFALASQVGYAMALAYEAARSPGCCNVTPQQWMTFLPFRSLGTEARNEMSFAGQLATWLAFSVMMAYAAIGLTYFRRHAALRTLVAAIGLAIVTSLLLVAGSDAVNFEALTAWVRPQRDRLDMPSGAVVFSWLFWLDVPLLLWAASYRALREKDLP